MPRRYTITEERRKQLSERMIAFNQAPETKALRSAHMAEFNKTPEMREARSSQMTEQHKKPGFTADLLASRWPKPNPPEGS